MKNIVYTTCLVLTLIMLCSCSPKTQTDKRHTSNEELTENQEISCDTNGHDYVNGVCTRCSQIIEVDMNQRISKPTELNFSYNSANGIDMYWRANNISGKEIKYCHLLIKFENAVGDPAYDEITGKDYYKCKLIGPYGPKEEVMLCYVVGYSTACSKIIIDEIMLEYTDGSFETGKYGWAYEHR